MKKTSFYYEMFLFLKRFSEAHINNKFTDSTISRLQEVSLKLNIQKTSRRRLGHLLNVLCATIDVMSSGITISDFTLGVYSTATE